MPKKSAALRIRITPALHSEFIGVCRSQELPASYVLRQLMVDYINKYRDRQQYDIFNGSNERKVNTSL